MNQRRQQAVAEPALDDVAAAVEVVRWREFLIRLAREDPEHVVREADATRRRDQDDPGDSATVELEVGQEPQLAVPVEAPALPVLLDEEVRRIVEECHREAVRLLTENRDRLDRIAEAVLKKDTLDQDEIYDAAGIARPASPRPVIAPPLPANGSSKRDGDLARDEVGSEIQR